MKYYHNSKKVKTALAAVLALFFLVFVVPVSTANEFISIEDVEVGDLVTSKDPKTGEVTKKTVVQTFVNETDKLVHIHVNGEDIVTTPSHPFYVAKLGWTVAADLRAGDELILVNGELVVVEFVQHELLENPVKVYNFEVEDFHTYFVGDVFGNGVWVHNLCGDEAPTEFEIVDYSDKATGYENHHGVLDKWATENIDGYVSRAEDSPSIRLTNEQHAATKSVYRDWLREKTGKPVGGVVDWKNVSPKEMQSLTESMFNAAKVPSADRSNYYRKFHEYIYSLES